MKHQWLIVLLIAVFALGLGQIPINTEAGAVNLTGTWELEYQGKERPIEMTFVLKQEGEKLNGTFSGVGPYPAAPVTGTVKENKAVFGFEVGGQMGTAVAVFKGAIESATKMTGTVGDPFCGSAPCNWTATKKK